MTKNGNSSLIIRTKSDRSEVWWMGLPLKPHFFIKKVRAFDEKSKNLAYNISEVERQVRQGDN